MENKIPVEVLEKMKREGWASLEEQARYWKDKELSATESACQWFDDHEKILDARINARLDAQAEYEEAQEIEHENENFYGPEFQTLGEYETDAERNR